MLSKNKIKFIQSLKLKKHRQKYNKFLAEGDKIIRTFLEMGHEPVLLYCLKEWWDEYEAEFHVIADSVEIIQKEQLKHISLLSTPSPVSAVFNLKETQAPDRQSLGVSFYLDGIQDPGNLGTIIRTLDWFGERRLYLSKDCVDPFNPKSVQASMGSVLNLDYIEADLEFLSDTFTIYGMSMQGIAYNEMNYDFPALIVLGNEGQGIRPDHAKYITSYVRIPRSERSKVDSLNAAISLSIICARVHLNQ